MDYLEELKMKKSLWIEKRADTALDWLIQHFVIHGKAEQGITSLLGDPTSSSSSTSEYLFSNGAHFSIDWTDDRPRRVAERKIFSFTRAYYEAMKQMEQKQKHIWLNTKDPDALGWIYGNSIKEGMTYNEVIGLLGTPNENNFESNPPYSNYFSLNLETFFVVSWTKDMKVYTKHRQ